jgi:hypothetical protein
MVDLNWDHTPHWSANRNLNIKGQEKVMKKQKSSRNSKCLGACPNQKDKNDYVKGQNKIIMPHQSNQKGQIEET